MRNCDPETCEADRNEAEFKLNSAYRERAHLVAFMAALYPSVIYEDGEWPIIYISSPEGQLSWHLSQDDLDLFRDVRVAGLDQIPRGESVWDGHSTEKKYNRIRGLTNSIYGMRKING